MKPKSDHIIDKQSDGTYTYPESMKLAKANIYSQSPSTSRSPRTSGASANAQEQLSSIRVWQSRPGLTALSELPFEVEVTERDFAIEEVSTQDSAELSAYEEANTPGRSLSISEDIIESTHVDIEPMPTVYEEDTPTSTILEEDDEPMSTLAEEAEEDDWPVPRPMHSLEEFKAEVGQESTESAYLFY